MKRNNKSDKLNLEDICTKVELMYD